MHLSIGVSDGKEVGTAVGRLWWQPGGEVRFRVSKDFNFPNLPSLPVKCIYLSKNIVFQVDLPQKTQMQQNLNSFK